MKRSGVLLVIASLLAMATSAQVPAGANSRGLGRSSPNAGGPISNGLSGVSCTSVTFCVAVGGYGSGSSASTLIESWNGTMWKIVPSPNPGSASYSVLSGVSCVSTTFCVAAGSAVVNGNRQTLIESWDGTSWTIVPSPNSAPNDQFVSVSCISASSCFAVGGTTIESNKTLIESWNGATWQIVPSPNPGTQTNELNGVSCVSSNFCVAAGDSSDGSHLSTLVERLVVSPSGAMWRVVPSPNPGVGVFDAFYGVTCLSSSSCTAVGGYLSPLEYDTLVESWDGTTWSVVPSPNPSQTQEQTLSAVSCVSTTNCTSVGDYHVSLNVTRTLIEVWDGAAWTIVSSPNPGSYQDFLTGVTCVSATSCTAAGSFSRDGTVYFSLIEAWDGVSWKVVPSPNVGLP